MKICVMVPTSTGWTWASKSRPWASPRPECQCVFAVALDQGVPNHLIAWENMGRPDDIPNPVNRAILHCDRDVGTDADIDVLRDWSRRELSVRILCRGRLPDAILPAPLGVEDRIFSGQ